MYKAFIVHNINNYYTNTILKNYFKSSSTSVPTGRGNEGRKNLQLLLRIPWNISHTASVHCLPCSSTLFSSDILWQSQLREQKLD